ncbi:MAG: fimbrillin family protein [Bacteroides sp.]|nr:fimbrillin family protein [Bacteroides sp.]
MAVKMQPGSEKTTTGEATTRWTNLDDNITFQVVAYKCESAAKISTSNYAGYGNYKLSGSSVQTITSLTLPTIGTYTFICYSYGTTTTIPAFSNSTTSVSATNGQNFMACLKPNVVIDNIGSKCTLSNIVFNHQCAQYRIQAKAQTGRMGNITACSAVLTSPSNSATYSFTNSNFTPDATSSALSITWSDPNGMNVYSNYIYLLPLSSKALTIKMLSTIGGRAYANKSITLSGTTFQSNGIYHSDISFTTTEGYIVGGCMWANGNLYYSSGKYYFYSNTMDCSKADNASDYFTYNNPLPNNSTIYTSWDDNRGPCRRVETAKDTWKTPTVDECVALVYSKAVIGADRTNYGGILDLPFGSFMRFTTGHPHESGYNHVGYYLCTTYGQCLLNDGIDKVSTEFAYPIRCVRI